MGISVNELMSLDYFKDFIVLAGHRGMKKKIQGVTLLDAPDGLRWAKGKELMLSSGYAIKMEPDCLKASFDRGDMDKISAFMLKRGRYVDSIPEETVALFNEHNIPLISMPFEISWMELMNRINTAVLNRTIKRFRITGTKSVISASYKERKINKILQMVELEMEFPAYLYDVETKMSYYSSKNFLDITHSFGLEVGDYLSPRGEFTRHTLCDFIEMTRYRLINFESPDEPRISWIKIPIVIDKNIMAYFVVMESKDFIDFYDEYSIRIAYLSLQNIYEQISVMRNAGNIGFENFIQFALNLKPKNIDKLVYQSNIQGISIDKENLCILFSQIKGEVNARENRKLYIEAAEKLLSDYRLAFIDENEGVLLFELSENKKTDYELLKKKLYEFNEYIGKITDGAELKFGMVKEGKALSQIRGTVCKCRRVIRMGTLMMPDKSIYEYEDLGVLAWIDVPEEELEKLLNNLKELIEVNKGEDLLETLKVYLENNLNYSTTASKLFIHINTVRKRIERVEEVLGLNFDNYITRLKLVILLQYLS